MAIILNADTIERVHIPPRVYRKAKLVSLREKQFPDLDNPGVMKDHIIWAFEIERKGGDVTIEAISSTAFGGKSNARRWATALLGGTEPTNPFDLEDLIGARAEVNVVDKTKDGVTFSKITDVFAVADEEEEDPPAKPAAAKPKAKPPAPEPEDDDDPPY